MRKLRKSLFALACAAAFFSCTKENNLETRQRAGLAFNVTNELSASKAVLDGNAVEFQAGDKIGVWDGTSMNCFETAEGGAHASFSGTAASAATYILISPYSANYSVNGSVVTYSIPDIQVATPGSVDPQALVSMAKVSGTSGEAVLYNCVGLVKVDVPDGLTVREIHVGGGAESSVGICGSFTFNTNERQVNYVDEGSMRSSITLVPQAGESVIAPGTYYIAVRPWTYTAGLTVAYVDEDNQLCKRISANSAAVERSHILPVGSLNTSDYAAVTGSATLRYAGDKPQFTGLLKNLAGGSGTASTTDNVIRKIVFRAHTLAYKAGGEIISNGPNSDVKIYAWIDGDTAYIYTEAPIITLYSTSNDLFRDFAALEEVSFNDVNTQAGANFEYMFRNCTSLKSVDFGNADFSKVANMQFMCDGCSNLLVARFGKTFTTSLQKCKAVFRGCTWMKELNLGPNFTITHLTDKSQCNNMFYETAMNSNQAAGADISKKCRLYMSQAEYDAARYDQGGVCANSALVPARFWLNPVDPVDPIDPDDPDPTTPTGPRFSIFGDSISTYAGYIQGYTTYYPYGSLNDVNMTYWMKLIAMFDGAALEKNISYSGSCVSYAEETFETSSTGRSYPLAARKTRCFLTRYAESGIGDPDVLILYGGTNDRVFCKGNVPRPGDHFVENGQYFYSEDGGKGQYSPASGEVEALCATPSADLDLDYFMPAYVELLRRIFNDHAEVKIVCLVGDGMTDAQDAWIKGVTQYFAAHGYQDRIKTVSFHNEGNYDGKHYDPNIPKVSGVHPDDAGMTYMANFIYNEIKDWI